MPLLVDSSKRASVPWPLRLVKHTRDKCLRNKDVTTTDDLFVGVKALE